MLFGFPLLPNEGVYLSLQLLKLGFRLVVCFHLFLLQEVKIKRILKKMGLALQFQQQGIMPLQIGPEVFKWLQGLGVVKEAKRGQTELMVVNEVETHKIMDGFVFAPIFKSLLASGGHQEKMAKIQSLKQNSTPAIRLYNWAILTEILKQLGYTVQASQKSKIVNYDPEPLAGIFQFLGELRAKDPSLKEQEHSNTLKVDIAQIGKKSIGDATNTLELLTICISKSFKISPQQTLNLFLDNNKYLSHLLAKGLKNSFQPILTLLTELHQQIEFIVLRLFCLDEQQNVDFLFNALRTCLISKEQLVAEQCCKLLLQTYDQYRLANLNLQAMRTWLTAEGINTLFFSMKKYPALTGTILTICYQYLDDQFFGYLKLTEKSVLWNTQMERLSFYKSFMEESNSEILHKFAITNYFEEWNKMFLKTMKKSKQKQEILLLLAIWEEEWNKERQIFEQSDLGLPNHYINFLKKIIMDPNQLLFLQAARTLFSLMQTLGQVKNPFAPLIYKILVTAFASFTDSSKIVFMSDNFVVSFRGITGLPGSALVPPLLQHLQSNKEWSVVELAQILIEERRIDEDSMVDLIEMLTKVTFSDIRFGSVVLEVIFSCLQQLAEEDIAGFLQNTTKACLAQLYSLSKSITKSIKYLKEEVERLKGSQQDKKTVSNFIAAASRHILCKNMIGFLAKAIAIDEALKQMLEPSVFHTYIKIKVQLKKIEQAELLKPILVSYYPEEEQLQSKIAYYMNEAYPPKAKPETRSRRREHSHNILSKSLTIRAVTAEQKEKETTVVDLDPSQLKPTQFAIKDLEKLKQKRYQLKTIEVERQKMRVLKEEKLQKFRTIQHEKRLVESMTTIKNDIDYSHIQTIEEKHSKMTIQPQTHQSKEVSQNIKLIDLEKEEEEAYQEDADSVIKRYKKVWRYLFFKYSLKKTEATGEDKIHMGEAWKMLRDYQFSFLRKEECFTIVRLVNEHLKRKNDIQYLNYEGFQDFILQVSEIGYSKTGYVHLPPGKHLLMFVEQLKKVTKQKSGSIQIFQKPEEAYFQETQVIRQFNKRLKQNPDYILPEGYKRVKQTSLEFEYDFHPMLQRNIKSSFIDVMEVIDNIIFSNPQLNFHIIEPLSIKSETFLAKPALFQNISQKMKQYSKGYLQPKKVLTSEKELISLPSPPKKKDFKPYVNFSLGIKLGVAETSLKNKSIAEQVAYCMEDMLNAIENNTLVVKKGNRRKIANDFLKRRRAEHAKIEAEKKKDEINWKKRAESVKLEVEALRKKREETDKQKRRKQFLDKKVKKEKEQKIYKEKMTQFERVKAKIAEKKEALLQLKEIEEEKMKKEKQQYREGVQEYFRKKKEEIRQKEEEYKKKKEEEKYQQEQAEQKKKEFVKRLYLANLKKEEEVLEKVDQIKENYDDVWKSTEIQQVMGQQKKSLKLLFDLLLKYEKSKISATNYDEIGLGTLNFFCLKFQVIPFMLKKQDVAKIFTYVTKNEEDKKNSRKGINFEKFQQVIFLISTKSKKMLNKMIEKRKKKEKKMQSFLNAQKSAGGNHFQAEDVSESSSSESEQSQEEKPTLQDQYLFDAEDVSQETLTEVFLFLRLPYDKQSMEERYKQALQVKTSKPRKELIRQIKESLDV